MTETAKLIKANHKKIRDKIKSIRTLLSNLQRDIAKQSILLDEFKRTTKGGYLMDLSDLLKITLRESQELNVNYKALIRRDKLDKLFLENMGIIDRKDRKKCQKSKSPSPLKQAGNLVSKVRELDERKMIGSNERTIIKEMLSQLEREL